MHARIFKVKICSFMMMSTHDAFFLHWSEKKTPGAGIDFSEWRQFAARMKDGTRGKKGWQGWHSLLRRVKHIHGMSVEMRFTKTWHHFCGCPELSYLAAAVWKDSFYNWCRYPVMNEGFSCTQQDKVIELDFQTVNLLNLSSTARLNSTFKHFLVGTFSFVQFEEEGISKATTCLQTPRVVCRWAACSQRSCRKKSHCYLWLDQCHRVQKSMAPWLIGTEFWKHFKKWAHQFFQVTVSGASLYFFFCGGGCFLWGDGVLVLRMLIAPSLSCVFFSFVSIFLFREDERWVISPRMQNGLDTLKEVLVDVGKFRNWFLRCVWHVLLFAKQP